MGNPNKDEDHDGAMGANLTSPQGADHANRNLNQEREARNLTVAEQVAEVVTRKMAKAHLHYEDLLNERSAATMSTSLKVTSGALGVKVMNPFDWFKDKTIYQ